ncbi:MAG: C40 family peptidase [Bacteroidetes bacterium]|nr:C40 family peptidase [Bacteroidota bacterium]
MQKVLLQTWCPLRKEPSSTSEMVSSLLFGETCTVLEEKGEWLLVSCDWDSYTGWIPFYYLHESELQFPRVLKAQGASWVCGAQRIHLSAGSGLPEADTLTLDGKTWQLLVREQIPPVSLWEKALGFLEVPYLWGGRSDCGMDCSGLTQVVYKMHGVQLPRDAWQQEQVVSPVSFHEISEGDLVFFGKEKTTHVGIAGPDMQIIHAHGKVRMDALKPEGIRNEERQEFSHFLRSAGRVKD